MSLRNRLLFTYVLLVAASFLCIIYLILHDVRPRYLEAVEDATVDIAELLAASLSQQAAQGTLDLTALDGTLATLAKRSISAKIYALTKRHVDLRVYVTDNKGMLLYDSTGAAAPGTDFSQWRDVYLTLRGQYGARSSPTVATDAASRVLYVAAPIMHNNAIAGVVSVGKPTNSVSFLIAIAQQRFLLGMALVGVSAVAFALLLSTWVTHPVKQLTQYARSIRQGVPQPLPRFGSAELTLLATALDEMQAKLEGKTYIEDYVRALTHEMKSPLTGIKGASEILRDHVASVQGNKFLGNIDTEVERLQRLVERMLQLSRLENARAIAKSPINGPALFRALADAFHTQLAEKNVHLALHVPQNTTLDGDELLLHQAFGNLIANAMDFSPPGTTITLTAVPGPHTLAVSIADQGTGIPDFAVHKVFDKFYSLDRPDTGKKSSGLGLPFVKEVVHLHGGTIALANTHPGLEVRIELPLG